MCMETGEKLNGIRKQGYLNCTKFTRLCGHLSTYLHDNTEYFIYIALLFIVLTYLPMYSKVWKYNHVILCSIA